MSMKKKAKRPVRARDKGVNASRALEKLLGPLTFGECLASIRQDQELTLEAFAAKLGISRQNLSDIEKGRKGVSVVRAIEWARELGHPEKLFAQLVLQDELRKAGADWTIKVA